MFDICLVTSCPLPPPTYKSLKSITGRTTVYLNFSSPSFWLTINHFSPLSSLPHNSPEGFAGYIKKFNSVIHLDDEKWNPSL
ncbi:hypothetical protein L1887_10073 [Cichorium endivia]|nr:hypothetical protein L1887_10073 [Cichorium endivia]